MTEISDLLFLMITVIIVSAGLYITLQIAVWRDDVKWEKRSGYPKDVQEIMEW